MSVEEMFVKSNFLFARGIQSHHLKVPSLNRQRAPSLSDLRLESVRTEEQRSRGQSDILAFGFHFYCNFFWVCYTSASKCVFVCSFVCFVCPFFCPCCLSFSLTICVSLLSILYSLFLSFPLFVHLPFFIDPSSIRTW